MKHRDIQLLKKIISECKDIIRYTNEAGEKGFFENDVYQKATAMSLLNIGEHANARTRELWTEYKDIQWRKLKHKYILKLTEHKDKHEIEAKM